MRLFEEDEKLLDKVKKAYGVLSDTEAMRVALKSAADQVDLGKGERSH
jgi:hypothetical protein